MRPRAPGIANLTTITWTHGYSDLISYRDVSTMLFLSSYADAIVILKEASIRRPIITTLADWHVIGPYIFVEWRLTISMAILSAADGSYKTKTFPKMEMRSCRLL